MATTLQAPFFPQFTVVATIDGSEVLVPAAGYKLRTTLTGTGTNAATYTDQAGAVPNTNPITLDSQGMCDLWLTNGTEYRLALYDSTNTTLQTGWPLDDIAGIPIVSTTQYVPLVGGVTMTGQYNLSGDATGASEPVPLSQAQTLIAASLATATAITSNSLTATTSAGTSTAYTLTPSSALASLATGATRKVVFHTASGANPTMAVSGLTAKSLKQFENDAKIAARFPSGYVADITYDGTDWVVTPSQAGYGTLAAATSWTHPGGFIEKWGTTGTLGVDTTTTITFPVPFPNNCFGVNANPSTDNGVNVGGSNYGWGTHTFTTTNFKISNDASASTFTWRAWGN